MIRTILIIIDNIRIVIIKAVWPGYFLNSLARRHGACKKCGACCIGCLFYSQRYKGCRVYKFRPPEFCQISFPYDKLQLKLRRIKNCGYFWNDSYIQRIRTWWTQKKLERYLK